MAGEGVREQTARSRSPQSRRLRVEIYASMLGIKVERVEIEVSGSSSSVEAERLGRIVHLAIVNLFDGNELQVEDKLRIGGNTGHGFVAVCKLGRNGDTSLTADSHALDANVPTFDDAAVANFKAEWFALLVRCFFVSFHF